jgi:hypothetical protein
MACEYLRHAFSKRRLLKAALPSSFRRSDWKHGSIVRENHEQLVQMKGQSGTCKLASAKNTHEARDGKIASRNTSVSGSLIECGNGGVIADECRFTVMTAEGLAKKPGQFADDR